MNGIERPPENADPQRTRHSAAVLFFDETGLSDFNLTIASSMAATNCLKPSPFIAEMAKNGDFSAAASFFTDA